MNDKQETFVRFSLDDRIQHLLIIVSFCLLALTGVPQKYSSLEWAKTLVAVMGGIDLVRTMHHMSAVVLGGTCLYHLFRGLYRLVALRARFEMWPTLKDARDALGNIAYFIGIRNSRPRFDRYNYMEKFEYWAVVWGMAVMSLTGLALLFPSAFTTLVPGIFIPAAKSVHGSEALLAVSAIVLWHLYNTHLNPRIFPINLSIFTGLVSKREMMEEHPVEYERKTGEPVPQEMLQGHPAKSWLALGISEALGAALVVIFALLIAWAIRPPAPAAPAPINSQIVRSSVFNPAKSGLAPEALPTILWQAGQSARPTADFGVSSVGGAGRLEGVPPLDVQFTNQSAGDITSWAWDFGDGATSDVQNPLHKYTRCPGAKEMCTVRLTVCGPGGCDTSTKADHLWISTKAK